MFRSPCVGALHWPLITTSTRRIGWKHAGPTNRFDSAARGPTRRTVTERLTGDRAGSGARRSEALRSPGHARKSQRSAALGSQLSQLSSRWSASGWKFAGAGRIPQRGGLLITCKERLQNQTHRKMSLIVGKQRWTSGVGTQRCKFGREVRFYSCLPFLFYHQAER